MTLATPRVRIPVRPDGGSAAARKPVAPRPSTRPPRIHGLDALRAVAVLAVMTFHLFPAVLPGGFVGVDVFFVLSGFLITTLLVRERVRTTRVSLRAFWARRARRLLPALVLVVVACTAVAGVLGGDVLVGIRAQVAGALTFSSNWVYIVQGATYSDDLSPQLFANFWSLALEEQFYLLWPLALLAVYTARRSRTVGLATTGVVGAASAVLMALSYQDGVDPSRAYFGTDTHLFGLMAGAFFALWFAPRGQAPRWQVPRPATPRARRWATALVGLTSAATLVVLALHLRTDAATTYRGGLVLASLATVGVIAVVVRGQEVARRIERGPLRWVGRRSYGLYLWHWPVVVLVAQVLDAAHPGRASDPVVAAVALVLTFLAAGLSYRFLEKPVLDRGMLTVARAVREKARDLVRSAWIERHGGWRTHGRRARLAGATALVVAVTACAGAALVRQPAHSDLEAEILRGQEIAAASKQPAPASPDTSVPHAAAPGEAVPGATEPAPTDPVPTTPAPTAPDPGASGAPAAPVPAPAAGPPPGDQVTVIGDSVTLVSAEALQAALPGVYIDAVVSRQMRTTAEVADALRAAGALRPYVVVSLATNSTVTERVMEEAIGAIGPGHTIVLVTGYGDRPWMGPTNDQIRAAAARHPEVVVADWQSALAAVPEGVGKDGVHPQGIGRDVYAQTLVAALTEAAARAAG